MEESDNFMQAESASQAGSVVFSDKMEFEQEDDGSIVRDQDMEVHEVAAEGSIADMKAAIAVDDAEMNAEMHEQENMQNEREWKDVEVDIVALDASEEDPVTSSYHADGQPTAGLTAATLEDESSAGPADDRPTNGLDHLTKQTEETSRQLTLEETMAASQKEADSSGAHSDSSVHPAQNGQKPSLVVSVPDETSEGQEAAAVPSEEDAPAGQEREAEQNEDDDGSQTPVQAAQEAGLRQYDDANEVPAASQEPLEEASQPHQPAPPTAAEFYDDFAVPSAGTSNRPVLQKDYLAHVEVFTDAPPSLRSSEHGPAAPHVLLTYNNETYSLFRPSSVSTGEDEYVLFTEDEEQSLYYSSLDVLIERLHMAFPHFRGDGDNELILDVGILDMQVSEDNIYCQQLSLHDFDRIRVGMCQPELDRLTVAVLTGKRLPYKFNELAEHVYRMYAGSEYESGAGYDEATEGEAVDAAEHVPGHYSEAAATEEAVESTQKERTTVLAAELSQPSEGEVAVAESATIANVELPGTEAEAAEAAEYEEEEAPEDQDDGATEAAYPNGDEDAEEVHPPSDEHYEDPEFSQQAAYEEGGDGEYHEEEEEAEEPLDYEDEDGDDGSGTLQDFTDELREAGKYGNAASHGDDEKIAEAELRLDPDAPLDELAEQLDEFEEGTLQQEEDLAADAKADRGDPPVDTDTGVNVEAVERDTERIYAGMNSLAAEENARVRSDVAAATVIPPAGHKALNGSTKRSREDDEDHSKQDEEHEAGEGTLSDGSEHAKRPKVGVQA